MWIINKKKVRSPKSEVGRKVRRLLTLDFVLFSFAALLVAGCRQDMHDAPRYEPLESSTFFTNGQSSRALVANTVARGQLREDEHLYTGRVGGQLATEFPMPVTAETMERGRERFNVFCSPCHGRTGDGTGMIVLCSVFAGLWPDEFADPDGKKAIANIAGQLPYVAQPLGLVPTGGQAAVVLCDFVGFGVSAALGTIIYWTNG